MNVRILVCCLIVWSIFLTLPESKISKYDRASQECEKALPRDRHCKIIGVVDESTEVKNGPSK